ncbi:MAG: hypothetical protein LBR15_09670 [Methanobrevibacter sp.]|jgi:hypothetical protein|nr:hypothetical protein [Candidatus Methanovirga australis]
MMNYVMIVSLACSVKEVLFMEYCEINGNCKWGEILRRILILNKFELNFCE